MPGASGAVPKGQKTTSAFDLKKAKASATWKSVEMRGGIRFAKVTAGVEVPQTRMLQLEFEKPIPARVTIEIETCIDGKWPDTKRSIETKGKSARILPDGRKGVSIELNIPSKERMTRKLAK